LIIVIPSNDTYHFWSTTYGDGEDDQMHILGFRSAAQRLAEFLLSLR
jgi:hypothetical protein